MRIFRQYIPVTLITLFILLSGSKISKAENQQDTIKQEALQQDTLRKKAPNVYLDCWFCDNDHIRKEINYVNYVRDRKDADVHIMVTSERAANGGNRYSVFMMGQN